MAMTNITIISLHIVENDPEKGTNPNKLETAVWFDV